MSSHLLECADETGRAPLTDHQHTRQYRATAGLPAVPVTHRARCEIEVACFRPLRYRRRVISQAERRPAPTILQITLESTLAP